MKDVKTGYTMNCSPLLKFRGDKTFEEFVAANPIYGSILIGIGEAIMGRNLTGTPWQEDNWFVMHTPKNGKPSTQSGGVAYTTNIGTISALTSPRVSIEFYTELMSVGVRPSRTGLLAGDFKVDDPEFFNKVADCAEKCVADENYHYTINYG